MARAMNNLNKCVTVSPYLRLSAVAAILIALLPARGNADAIDDYIKARMTRLGIPGLSFAVTRSGSLVRRGSYGFANVEWKAPTTADSIYEIGSITKPFTAVAVLMLVEQGAIRLDQRISSYLPGLPNAWEPVTIGQLLSHTSGIREYATNVDVTLREVREPQDAIKAVASLPLDFAPGASARYSSTNFVLLGLLIEKVAGKSYSEFMNEHIFKPLGMASTRLNDPAVLIPNRAQGYGLRNGTLRNRPAITEGAAFSAGALISTVDDLVKFDAALYTGELLKHETIEQMWTPVKTADGRFQAVLSFSAYGLGWGMTEHNGRRCVWHGGQSLGFQAVFAHFPEERLTVIVLSNLNSSGADGIAFALAGMMEPGLGLFSVGTMPPERDDQPELTSRLRAYLLDFVANNGKDLPMMTPGLIRDIRPNERKDQSFKVNGLTSFSFIAREDVSGKEIFRYGSPINHVRYCRLANPQGTFLFTFWMTEQGKVGDWIASRD